MHGQQNVKKSKSLFAAVCTVPCHEDSWGSRGSVTDNIKLDATRRVSGQLHAPPTLFVEKVPPVHIQDKSYSDRGDISLTAASPSGFFVDSTSVGWL